MYAMGPHSTYLYDDKSLCAVGSVCKRFHVPMHIHMQETKSELENSVAGNHEGANCHRSDQKCSPIANLARLGLLNGTICAHCVHVLDSDIALLQKHGASAVHCPRSNLKLGSGLAPVQRMLDTGVNVCLGTDGASSNNSLDMLSELVHVNKYYMVHSFTKEYGISPINYLISRRIEESKYLLSDTDHSLSQISHMLGFSSPSYFSQSFRRLEGMSPMEFRRSSRSRAGT